MITFQRLPGMWNFRQILVFLGSKCKESKASGLDCGQGLPPAAMAYFNFHLI